MLEPQVTAKLVAAAVGGDREAWERLVDEYANLVWAVVRSCGLYGAEAADVSQTVWLRFVEHIGRLREPERAGAWLATTARHECFRVLRRSGRQLATGDVPEVAAPDAADLLVDTIVAADDRSTVMQALDGLPARCQELLRLMATEPPLTYDEIAETLGVRRGWIGPTRGRCIDRLRRAMGGLAGPAADRPGLAG